jgi:hypothetical protein
VYRFSPQCRVSLALVALLGRLRSPGASVSLGAHLAAVGDELDRSTGTRLAPAPHSPSSTTSTVSLRACRSSGQQSGRHGAGQRVFHESSRVLGVHLRGPSASDGRRRSRCLRRPSQPGAHHSCARAEESGWVLQLGTVIGPRRAHGQRKSYLALVDELVLHYERANRFRAAPLLRHTERRSALRSPWCLGVRPGLGSDLFDDGVRGA